MSIKGGVRGPGLGIWAGLVCFFLVLPLVVVIPVSFSSKRTMQYPPEGFTTHWYAELNSSTWLSPIMSSLQVASWTALFASVIGTAAAVGLVRGRFFGRALLAGLLLSPMVLPVVVLAIAMFSVFSYVHLAGSPLALILAHTTLALPFVIVSVASGLQSIDPQLELAAGSLGAGPVRTFVRITLPLLAPSIATGALLAFITSWDEVVLALFFTTPVFETLPTQMWQQINESVDPSVAAIATGMIVITSLLCVVAVAVRRARSEQAS